MNETPWYVKCGWLWVGLIFVIYLFASWLATKPVTSFSGMSFEKLAQIGDSFGALTALFSGLAFWAAIYILIQQKNEFKSFSKRSIENALMERSHLWPNFKLTEIAPHQSYDPANPIKKPADLAFVLKMDKFSFHFKDDDRKAFHNVGFFMPESYSDGVSIRAHRGGFIVDLQPSGFKSIIEDKDDSIICYLTYSDASTMIVVEQYDLIQDVKKILTMFRKRHYFTGKVNHPSCLKDVEALVAYEQQKFE
jgi:hypothetical protein